MTARKLHTPRARPRLWSMRGTPYSAAEREARAIKEAGKPKMTRYECPRCGAAAWAPIGPEVFYRYAVCHDEKKGGCGWLLKLEAVMGSWSVDDVMLVKPPRKDGESREAYRAHCLEATLEGLGKIVENWQRRGIVCRVAVDTDRGRYGIQLRGGDYSEYDEAGERDRRRFLGKAEQ